MASRSKTFWLRAKSYKADTLEELAKKAGINAANLVETVKKWNEFCKKGTGDEMGRRPAWTNTVLTKAVRTTPR